MTDSENAHKIEAWNVEDLVPYENNAKKHPPEQVENIVNSIRKFGWTQPIVIWKNGEIIAGHGRRLAAIELGLKKVPVIVRRDLTQTEANTLRLADNKVSSNEYDQAMMASEMNQILIDDPGMDFLSLGWNDSEMEMIQEDPGDMDIDHFEDEIAEAVENQRAENEKSIQNADDTAAPVVDALGFKRVKIAQSRRLRELMVTIHAKSEDPVEGMISAIEKGLGAS
jgi:ParB-like chromosome segregation protein Spo0J